MGNVKKQLYACRDCGDDINPRRVQLGYRLCLWCGEDAAQADRKRWTVVQEYNKGGYMFITPTAVAVTLKQTNPKEQRT
jgi:ribosomal protein L37AE/L43A